MRVSMSQIVCYLLKQLTIANWTITARAKYFSQANIMCVHFSTIIVAVQIAWVFEHSPGACF